MRKSNSREDATSRGNSFSSSTTSLSLSLQSLPPKSSTTCWAREARGIAKTPGFETSQLRATWAGVLEFLRQTASILESGFARSPCPRG